MLTAVAIEGYRSIRSLRFAVGRVTVVTGPNGSGKSSLYRALRLLAAAGRHGAVAALAREGGLPSVLWAGPEVIGRAVREGRAPVQGVRRTRPIALRCGFAGDGFGYAMDLGLPQPSGSLFGRDPEIKAEAVWHGEVLRPATLLAERRGPLVRVRQDDGWHDTGRTLDPWQSMLDEVESPELRAVRSAMRSWRFYDHVRTDQDAPARTPSIGTRTSVLAADGSDLAATLQTIREIGREDLLDAAVADAFPGTSVRVAERDGRFDLLLQQPGMLRPLTAADLSDGTLRYLVWIAALLSPRPAEFAVLNEPETSLHPDLLPPLAALMDAASSETQLLVVTHAGALRDALVERGAAGVALERPDGETVVAGQGALDGPPWHWPSR